MRTQTIAIPLLLLTVPLAAPPASASEFCVEDFCVELSDTIFLDTCTMSTRTYTGFWFFYDPLLGRDPVIPNTYYYASWTVTTCDDQAYGCKATVSDGSSFQYARVGGIQSASGDYKGIPTAGGYLGCSAGGASLTTYYAGLVGPLYGYGFR